MRREIYLIDAGEEINSVMLFKWMILSRLNVMGSERDLEGYSYC